MKLLVVSGPAVGELAALFRLSGSKNAVSLGEAARSVLLVAGTRNHRQYTICVDA